MTKSIIQSDRSYCYICGSRRNLEEHHCWGSYNRKKSTEDGLVVTLCRKCHADLHDHGYEKRFLQRTAEEKWLKYYTRTEKEFRERYGKSVLDKFQTEGEDI